jgi:hypothetical protein
MADAYLVGSGQTDEWCTFKGYQRKCALDDPSNSNAAEKQSRSGQRARESSRMCEFARIVTER